MSTNYIEKYNKIWSKFYYIEKKQLRRIFSIFAGSGGSMIVNQDIVPDQFKIKDFLIINPEIRDALNKIKGALLNIDNSDEDFASSLFYFSQYGGSKTQFIHLVEEEVLEGHRAAVVIKFSNLSEIKPKYLFQKIISGVIRTANNLKKLQSNAEFERFSSEFEEINSRINIAMSQSSNLQKAEKLLDELETKSVKRKRIIKRLDALLHSSILVDNIDLLNKIINLMQLCTRYGMIFVFLFDEVDLWLKEHGNELSFSEQFNKMSKFMKRFLEIPNSEIKTLFVFSCTDRVNKLLQKHEMAFSSKSPTGSRLVKIYQRANKIAEPGIYGDSIEQAFVKLAVFYDLIHNGKKKLNNKEFYQNLKPALEKDYRDISRRDCNSKLINIIESYYAINPALRMGSRFWRQQTKELGNLLQNHLSSILKKMSTNFQRKDILIEPDKQYTNEKIDGYFVNFTLDGKKRRLYAEIKVAQQFNSKKAHQVLQWVQLREEPIILLVFSPDSEKNINKSLIGFAERNDIDLNKVKEVNLIHVQNPYAYCPILGIKDIEEDPKKLKDFLDNFSLWLNLFGNFSEQYQKILNDFNLREYYKKKKSKPRSIAQGQKTENTPKEQNEEETPQYQLTTSQKNCIQILANMFRNHKFTSSGRKRKSSIQGLVQDESMGITNLDKHYKEMKKAGIVERMTDKTVYFTITKDDEILNSGLEGFLEFLEEKFANSKDYDGLFGL